MSYLITKFIEQLLLAIVISILALNTANGANCYQPSLQFNKLNDEYYDIGLVRKLSKQDKKNINDFFQNISGRWRGDFFVIECEGSEKKPRAVSKKGRVLSEIRYEPEGVLIIEGDIDYTTEKSASSRKIKTLGWDSIFTLKQINKEGYEFTEKFRKGAIGGGAPLVEHLFRITMEGDKKLNIIQTIYYNGFYSIEESWTLSK